MRREQYEKQVARREMIPLRITALLEAPVCSDEGWVNVDAVVAYAVAHDCHYPFAHRPAGVTSRDEISPPPPLPFATVDGVTACSCLWPDNPERGSTDWSMRPALEYAHLATPNNIRIDGGVTRLRRERVTIWPARSWTAYCLGEPTILARMLRHVHSIGHKRSQGYGAVSGWLVEPDEIARERWRVREDGTAARALPDPRGDRIGVMPPYWYRPWWERAIRPGQQVPERVAA